MLHFNLYPNKMLAGCFASLAALICDNLLPLFITIIVFELMDFATGVMKSAVLAKRAGGKFSFEAVLPDFMNNYSVAQIVERTADIDLLTDTIIDSKIYFANDSSVNKYNYVVFLVKP